MTLLTLSNSERFHVSADRLVYSRAEIRALGSTLDQCEKLKEDSQNHAQRLSEAVDQGYQSGFEKGTAAGHEDALGHIAVRLVTLGKEANEARAKLESTAGDLAVQIVEKIASRLAAKDVISALAIDAARELIPAERIVVRVHPSLKEQVAAEVDGVGSNLNTMLMVEADAGLTEADCVLETEYGHVKADLETQLDVLRGQFSG